MTSLIIIAAASILLGFFINYLLVKVPKLKIVFQILFPIAIVVLGYYLYDGINTPIQFKKRMDVRYEKVEQNLIDIRTAQVAYKQVYGKYAKDFDRLIYFVKYDSIPLVKAEGSIPDSLLEAGMTERQAIKAGIIVRDTMRVAVIDTKFSKDYPVDSLRYIPCSNGAEFDMDAKKITTGSNVKVEVFEAKAHYAVWLKGLNHQLIINLIDERKVNDKYEGLKVGSLVEANNNAGNWE